MGFNVRKKGFLIFIALIGLSNPVIAKDDCSTLERKSCLKEEKCRWSKPKKMCISNRVVKHISRPNARYNTKSGERVVFCDHYKKKNHCLEETSCGWNRKKKLCYNKPKETRVGKESTKDSNIISQEPIKMMPQPENNSEDSVEVPVDD